MNPLKAWNAKLDAVYFWPSKNLYRQCALEELCSMTLQFWILPIGSLVMYNGWKVWSGSDPRPVSTTKVYSFPLCRVISGARIPLMYMAVPSGPKPWFPRLVVAGPRITKKKSLNDRIHNYTLWFDEKSRAPEVDLSTGSLALNLLGFLVVPVVDKNIAKN